MNNKSKMIRTIALGLALATSLAAQAQLDIKPKESTATWTGTKVSGAHHGHVDIKSGTIIWGAAGLDKVNVTMDMTTITCIDLQGPRAERLVEHLKAEDFFDTRNHPEAKFVTTKVERIAGAAPGQPNYKVTGDLTIKGVTAPVSFPVLVHQEGNSVVAAGTMTFDRTKYDIKYRSGSIFPDLGDKVIHDSVELGFRVVAR